MKIPDPKSILAAAVFLFLPTFLAAFTASDVRCFTIENGLTVFVLPDSSSAPVRIELDVDAGFSRQTQTTAGFFPLYARLAGGDCSADTVRFTETVAPEGVGNTLAGMIRIFSPLTVSDEVLKTALDEMKSEVTQYAFSTAGFVNTAIDARMFASSPWKQESGVYPALFSRTTAAEARTVLTSIGKQYYIPQNASLYISGNITAESAVALVKESFARGAQHDNTAQSSSGGGSALLNGVQSIESVKEKSPNNTARKFVLTDAEFSPDMTQIVVQYDGLAQNDANTIAAIFSDNGSILKRRLLLQKQLAIRGAEYINAASAQKRGSSRLIIQSLLEPAKISPVQQAELFISTIQSEQEETNTSENQNDFTAQPLITDAAVINAHALYHSDFTARTGESEQFMELLSAWHSLTLSTDTDQLFSLGDVLDEQTAGSLSASFTNQTPFVFVLVNKTVFEKNEKAFAKAGYTKVTAENGSWYTMELYTNMMKNSTAENHDSENKTEDNGTAGSAERYIKSNRAEFSTSTLLNGIPVTIKQSEQMPSASFCIIINGGELLFADTHPGLCSVLTDALARNIQTQLDIRAASGIFHGTASVAAKTNISSSTIAVTCSSEDISSCIEAAGTALIYSDIVPSQADESMYGERTEWRIKTGSTEFQLLCSAIRTLYKNDKKISEQENLIRKKYRNLYDDSTDIPASAQYAEIKKQYTKLLDASLYSIIIAGGVPGPSALVSVLNRTFGVLVPHAELKTESSKTDAEESLLVQETKIPVPDFSPAKKIIKLRHLFFSDVSSDKAGPRPEVLVPTKNFSDPVLYIIAPPASGSIDSPLFNALLFELSDRLQRAFGQKMTVKTTAPSFDLPFAQICITNVEKTSAVDALYAKCVEGLIRDLNALTTVPLKVTETGETDASGRFPLLTQIQGRWMLRELSETGSSEGTAKLICAGALYGNPQKYLDDYESISSADAAAYSETAKKYFTGLAPVRLYSADAK